MNIKETKRENINFNSLLTPADYRGKKQTWLYKDAWELGADSKTTLNSRQLHINPNEDKGTNTHGGESLRQRQTDDIMMKVHQQSCAANYEKLSKEFVGEDSILAHLITLLAI